MVEKFPACGISEVQRRRWCVNLNSNTIYILLRVMLNASATLSHNNPQNEWPKILWPCINYKNKSSHSHVISYHMLFFRHYIQGLGSISSHVQYSKRNNFQKITVSLCCLYIFPYPENFSQVEKHLWEKSDALK